MRGRKLQCSDRRLLIFNRGDHGFSKFQCSPKCFQNGGLGPKFCIFGRKFSDLKQNFQQFSDSPQFRGGGNNLPPATLQLCACTLNADHVWSCFTSLMLVHCRHAGTRILTTVVSPLRTGGRVPSKFCLGTLPPPKVEECSAARGQVV